MGDSATPPTRGLREAPGVRLLMSFRQAEGYVRRPKFLSHLTLPEGALVLGKDYPSETVSLVGPAVELVAHRDLHHALSDLLIAAAREIHSGPGMYRTAGEFPAPPEHDFPISAVMLSATTNRAASSCTSGLVLVSLRASSTLRARRHAAAARDRHPRDARGAVALLLARAVADLPLGTARSWRSSVR